MTETAGSPMQPEMQNLDQSYLPFPRLAEWSTVRIDTLSWDRYATTLKQLRGSVNGAVLQRADEVVRRAAAVDTGAIEGLYDVDTNFTMAVARQASMWEAKLSEKGPDAVGFIRAQLETYEHIRMLANEQESLSEAAIRHVHSQICASQDLYTAVTEVGVQQQRLPKGQYKSMPNHVRNRAGRLHAFAPVDITPAEMHRLLEELRSEPFATSHPVLQAAYAHYALVAIHPFADGNGRVARAVSSLYVSRAVGVPLLLLSEHRQAYFDSLMRADDGDPQSFVSFVQERAIDAMQLVSESIAAAQYPTPIEMLNEVRRLSVTRSGLTHDDVDKAGVALMKGFASEMQRVCAELSGDPVFLSCEATAVSPRYQFVNDAYRLPRQGGIAVRLIAKLMRPVSTQVVVDFALEIPKDSGSADDIVIRSNMWSEIVEARVNELHPTMSGILVMRLRMNVEKIVAGALSLLQQRAAAEIKAQGL